MIQAHPAGESRSAPLAPPHSEMWREIGRKRQRPMDWNKESLAEQHEQITVKNNNSDETV